MGSDDYAVGRRSAAIFAEWRATADEDVEVEIIEGRASSAAEASRSIGSVRAALQTLPFFGGAKLVWWKDIDFFEDSRKVTTKETTAALSDWVDEMERMRWDGVRLLISAGKVDKRRAFFKKLKGLCEAVETFEGWSINDRDWREKAEAFARGEVGKAGKRISFEALSYSVDAVGPDPRALAGEMEKLALFVGDRETIEVGDCETIVSRNKQARAFAMADALGDRNPTRLMQLLEDELWSLKTDRSKSEIGLLYGIIYKVRALILLKALLNAGLIRPTKNYGEFQRTLKALPEDRMPKDSKFNPKSISPFVFFRALSQVGNYSEEELTRGMRLLLEGNRKMVSSGLDPGDILRDTALRIVKGA